MAAMPATISSIGAADFKPLKSFLPPSLSNYPIAYPLDTGVPSVASTALFAAASSNFFFVASSEFRISSSVSLFNLSLSSITSSIASSNTLLPKAYSNADLVTLSCANSSFLAMIILAA